MAASRCALGQVSISQGTEMCLFPSSSQVSGKLKIFSSVKINWQKGKTSALTLRLLSLSLLAVVCFEMWGGAGANSVWRLCSAVAPLTIKFNSGWCEMGQRAMNNVDLECNVNIVGLE